MSTRIQITRETPFTRSDTLREDADLFAEAEHLRVWLADREIVQVTMGELLAFEKSDHADAVLDRQEVEYVWEWDPDAKLWHLVCVDKGAVIYHLPGQSDAIVIRITISATY